MTHSLHARQAASGPSLRRREEAGLAVGALIVGLAAVILGSGGHPAGALARVLNSESASSGGMTAADGYLGKAGVSVLDDRRPALTRLDPALLAAVREAARDAAAEGVDLTVSSGWRSPRYQQHLLDQAVAERGSYTEALRWVKTPAESTHVTGKAVDIGPTEAAYWLSRKGAAYGLCQVYANEIWHYELLAGPDGVCPTMKADSAS